MQVKINNIHIKHCRKDFQFLVPIKDLNFTLKDKLMKKGWENGTYREALHPKTRLKHIMGRS